MDRDTAGPGRGKTLGTEEFPSITPFPASAIAQAIAFAIERPADVDVKRGAQMPAYHS